eukprot:6184588-Pleurochrysis_carterae.AAC.2
MRRARHRSATLAFSLPRNLTIHSRSVVERRAGHSSAEGSRRRWRKGGRRAREMVTGREEGVRRGLKGSFAQTERARQSRMAAESECDGGSKAAGC